MTTTLLRIVMMLAAVFVLPTTARSGEAHWPETLTIGTGWAAGCATIWRELLSASFRPPEEIPT